MFDWTDEIKDKLFDLISTGNAIREIAGKDGFPVESTFYRKMASDPEFASFIARAREMQQEHEADYMVELADSATPEDAHVKKLQIWARQWRAAKLAPKKFGERIAQEITGADGGPIQSASVTLPPDQESALQTMLSDVQNRVKKP